MKNDFAVCFEGVSKKFKNKNGEKITLNFPNFWIAKGKTTAMLGPSGVGKTTAAKIISGIESKDSGDVVVHKTSLNKKTQAKIRKSVAFVFQNFNLFPHMSVIDNIIYAPLKVLHKDRLKTEQKAYELLKQLGLYEKKNCMPCELSIGQKQRVAIIRALMTDSDILVMDEPTASLDPRSIHDLVGVVNSLKKRKITIIIVTHDLAFAKKVADYAIPFFKKNTDKKIAPVKIDRFFEKNSKDRYVRKFLEEYGSLL
jgi:ABC-type polar amino acid transport system ATPase subunit